MSIRSGADTGRARAGQGYHRAPLPVWLAPVSVSRALGSAFAINAGRFLPPSELDDSPPILFKPHFGLSSYHLVMGVIIDTIYHCLGPGRPDVWLVGRSVALVGDAVKAILLISPVAVPCNLFAACLGLYIPKLVRK